MTCKSPLSNPRIWKSGRISGKVNKNWYKFVVFVQNIEASEVQSPSGVWRRWRHRLHQREEYEVQQEAGTILRQIHGGDKAEFGARYSDLNVTEHGFRPAQLALQQRLAVHVCVEVMPQCVGAAVYVLSRKAALFDWFVYHLIVLCAGVKV